MALAPRFGGIAEIEPAQRAADREMTDLDRRIGRGRGEIAALAFHLESRERAAHLAHLRVDPFLPLEFARPQRFVARENAGIEDAVAECLLSQRAPARLARRREE